MLIYQNYEINWKIFVITCMRFNPFLEKNIKILYFYTILFIYYIHNILKIGIAYH